MTVAPFVTEHTFCASWYRTKTRENRFFGWIMTVREKDIFPIGKASGFQRDNLGVTTHILDN